MTTPTQSNTNSSSTSLSLTDSTGRQRLKSTLADYVAFLHRQPAVCGTAEQQQTLIQHVAQGHDLIKLVAAERLKITRELDHQKQDWMELEKKLTAPIVAAMQPLKDAVEHYNREVIRADYALADLFGVHAPTTTQKSIPDQKLARDTYHTYVRLTPALRAQMSGPHTDQEPPVSTAKRHPILNGFEETDILPYGEAGFLLDNTPQCHLR